MKSYDTGTGFPSNIVNQVMCARDGRMWVATAEGLVCFTGRGGYKTYAKGCNLANLHIRAVAEDRHGNIWVSTNKGISAA